MRLPNGCLWKRDCTAAQCEARRRAESRSCALMLLCVLLCALLAQAVATPAAAAAEHSGASSKIGTAVPAPATATHGARNVPQPASTPVSRAAAAQPVISSRPDRVPQPMEGALGILFDVVLPPHLRGGPMPGPAARVTRRRQRAANRYPAGGSTGMDAGAATDGAAIAAQPAATDGLRGHARRRTSAGADRGRVTDPNL